MHVRNKKAELIESFEQKRENAKNRIIDLLLSALHDRGATPAIQEKYGSVKRCQDKLKIYGITLSL